MQATTGRRETATATTGWGEDGEAAGLGGQRLPSLEVCFFLFLFHNLFSLQTTQDSHDYTNPRGPTAPRNGKGQPTNLQEIRRIRERRGPGDNGPRTGQGRTRTMGTRTTTGIPGERRRRRGTTTATTAGRGSGVIAPRA